MHVVEGFKYLGSFLACDCSHNRDIEGMLESAGEACGTLRMCMFGSSSIPPRAQRVVYTTIILSLFMFGLSVGR